LFYWIFAAEYSTRYDLEIFSTKAAMLDWSIVDMEMTVYL
jgi:hypothetical protein